MANNLAVNDLVKTQIYTFDTSQIGINTFWFSVASVGGSPSTDLDLASSFDAVIGPLMPAVLNNNAEYRGTRVQVYNPGTFAPKWVDVVATGNAGNGTAGSTALPKQTSGITSWYTNVPKQAFRGRTYWPFPATAADSGDGYPTSGYVTAINTIASAIRTFTAIAAGGRSATLLQVLFHRKVPGSSPIVSYQGRIAWATQRRRGTYGRPQANPPF